MSVADTAAPAQDAGWQCPRCNRTFRRTKQHLGLPVSDVRRSRQFYETYFGFDPATAEQYDDGTVIIRNSAGFDLALHAVGEAGRLPEFLHFGFKVRDTDAVRTMLARLKADGIEITEELDTPAYAASSAWTRTSFPWRSTGRIDQATSRGRRRWSGLAFRE